MANTITAEKISKANYIPIETDELVQMFGEALAPTTPLSNHAGRHFTGTFKGFDKGLLHYEGRTQSAWDAVWKMIGIENPPMKLPPNCSFNFITLGRKGCDTLLDFKGATQSLSQVKMNWDYACIPGKKAGKERTQYHMTIIPESKVENNLTRLNVAANGTIIRPQPVANIS